MSHDSVQGTAVHSRPLGIGSACTKMLITLGVPTHRISYDEF
jgi:hypothetical protein